MVTRTISSMPYLGGQFNQLANQQAMVRLTPSRMVWVYSQLNPNWIITSIIDTQGGYTSANMPVATTQQLTIQGSLNSGNYQTFASRLSDNMFLITSIYGFAANGTGLPTYYWVCSIDGTNTVSVVDSGSYTIAYASTNWFVASSASANSTTFAELADNIVSVHHHSGATNPWLYYNLVFNTTTQKLVPPTVVNVAVAGASLPSATNADWHVSKVPDRPQYTMITRRYGTANQYAMNGSVSLIMDNTGAIYMPYNTLPQNAPTSASVASGFGDLVPMQGDRLLITSMTSATMYAIDYSAKTWRQISQSQFSSLTSPDTAGRYVIPLNADYWLMLSRQNFWATGTTPAMRGKVVRRVDAQFMEQSAASNGNTGNGFTISALPSTFMNPQGQYPELVNGKIFYWGFDAASTGNVAKLSWSVLSLPAS